MMPHVLDDNHDRWVQRLTAGARSSEVLDLTTGASGPGQLDPAHIDTWPTGRRVPATAIRATLLDPELHPDQHGLRLRGASITPS